MSPKKPQRKPFATEAELCARFLAAIGEDWTAYAETGGWDILLVRKADGFQIGIEAKLKFNLEVVTQALESGGWSVAGEGPDCRAVLVPEDQGRLGVIAAYIGLTVIRVKLPEEKATRYDPAFRPALPKAGQRDWHDDWYEWAPAERHKLPDYVPDVVAGSPAPVQLTEWKIKAIKIAITFEKRGYLTREDFKHHNIDHRRWMPATNGWVMPKNGVLVATTAMPDFKRMHPTVYAQIEADSAKWMLPALKLPAHQPSLLEKA